MPGQIGLIQATEAIKLVLKIGKPMTGQFLVYNVLEPEFRVLTVRKNPSCPLCNGDPKIRELSDESGDPGDHEVCEVRA